MKYKLAKQLKDAGFPQIKVGGNYWIAQDKPLPQIWGQAPEETVLIPTLSELIEACGDDLDSLVRDMSENKLWIAYRQDGDGSGEGKTPGEAVAKLWLKLNEK